MATLFNTKISNTYQGLLKTVDNAAISATLRELSDGSGNQTGLYLNTAGDFKVTSVLEWGSLKDTGTGVTITRYVTSTDGLENFDNNTSLPTSAAVKLYVDTKFATSDTLQEVLSFGNTTSGNDIVVSLNDDITFTDSSKALFGNSQDLEINHNGTDSFVTDLGTGDLRLRSDNSIKIQASTGGNNLATFTKGAGVDLYFNNAKKLETTNTGVSVTGIISNLTNPNAAQDAATKSYVDALDAGSDLDITDGTNTGAVNLNTQTLSILGTTNEIETVVSGQGVTIGLPSSISTDLVGNVTGNLTGNVAGDLTGNVTSTSVLANGVTATTQASTDSSTKVATTAYVKGLDNASDLDFSGDSGTGDVNLNAQTFAITGTANQIESSASNQGLSLQFPTAGVTLPNGSVATTQSADDNSTKVATTSYVDTSAALYLPLVGGTMSGNTIHNDSIKSIYGTGSDAQVYHDGSNFYANNSTGQLNIDQSAVTESIVFKTSDANALDTTALIINRGGDLITGRDVTIAGDLTVNGTTTTVNSQTLSVDDPLISLAINNAANSLDIGYYGKYNDGTTRYLGLFNDSSDSNKFKLFKGTTVEPTTTVNIGAAGYAAADLELANLVATGNINLADNGKAIFGTGNDLQIYHDGSNSYIKDTGTGSLILQSSDLFLRTNSTENAIVCAANAGVTLYYNNVSKLATTSTGVSVTGGGTFSGNLEVTGTITGAGGSFLPLIGGTMTGATTHNDSVYSYWGTGDDLQIGHDGTNSYILDKGAGDLLLYYNDDFVVSKYGTSEVSIRANADSSVELFFDNAQKLATTTSGINVTGGGTFTGALTVQTSVDGWATHIDNNATTTPSGLLIDAGSSSTNFAMYVRNSATTSDLFAIKGNGNVGIGTDSPSANLEIAASIPTLRLTNTQDPLGNGTVGNFEFFTNDSSTGAKRTVSSIVCDNQAGSSVPGGDLVFKTSLGGGGSPVATEKLRIKDNGNVGIGTASPSAKLDIQQATAGNIISAEFDNTDYTANNRNAIKVRQQVSVGGSYSAFLGVDKETNNLFLSNDSITADHLVIDSAGNVGIGTDSPEQKLEINAGAHPTIVVSSATDDCSIAFKKGTGATPTWRLGRDASNSDALTFAYDASGYPSLTGNYKAVITTGGNVGIGTDSPDAKLEVDVTDSSSILKLTRTGSASFSTLISDIGEGAAQLWFNADTDDTGFVFRPRDSDGNPNNAFFIAPSGNVGIGTTSPSNNFVVAEGTDQHGIELVPGTTSFIQAYDRATSDYGDLKIDAQTIAFGTDNGTERMRITSGGDVLIGTTAVVSSSQGGAEFLAGESGGRRILRLATTNTSVNDLVVFINGNGTVGTIRTNGSSTSYNTSSDYRLKEDLQDFAGLDMVSKIPVYDFKWKTDESRSYGVMAHELQEVLPDAVSGEKDAEEMQGVDYSKIVPLLIKSIQELKAEIDILKAK